MAVTAFDGTFSFRQEELARMNGHEPTKMTEAQWEEFQNSPFMKSMRKADEIAYGKTAIRDEERKKRDPEFNPEDSDFTGPKAFEYEKAVSYYKVLGVDDLASLGEIKQSYKKLSLIFHPDKSAGMTQKEKDENNAVFIELKNAYKTLSDRATRRQYDYERDRDLAVQEVNGWKVKTKVTFDATELLKKMTEENKAPGKTVEIPVKCRLEKYFWGGFKGIQRSRQIKDWVGYQTEEKTFRLDVAQGAPEDLAIEFKYAGDHQEETRPDTLKFIMSSKPHEVVERSGNDLVVKKKVSMRPDTHTRSHISGQVESIRGRAVVFWGRNPFFRTAASGSGEIKFKVFGEGLLPENSLNFTAKVGASGGTENTVVIRLTQLVTKAEMAMRIPKNFTIGDVAAKARSILDFVGAQNVKLVQAKAGGYIDYPESQAIGTMRSLECGGTQWSKVPLGYEKSIEFLEVVTGQCETDAFKAKLADGYRLAEDDRSTAKSMIFKAWEVVQEVLPDFGFDSTLDILKKKVPEAISELEGDDDCKALVAKAKDLVIGFDPKEYERKGLMTAKPCGRAGHPLMEARRDAKMTNEPVCDIELWPMAYEPITLYTQPAGCTLTFFSNAKQAAIPPQGQMAPRLMFAVVMSCGPGAKKEGATAWQDLKENVVPLVEDSFFCMLKQAMGTMPKAVSDKPAFADEEYKLDPDVATGDGFARQVSAGDDEESEEEEEQEEEKDEDEDEDDGFGDGGGGMFDFDDMDEDNDKAKAKAEKAEAKKKRRAIRKALKVEMKFENQAMEKRKAALERQEAADVAKGPAMPWRSMASAAFSRGDFYTAEICLTRQLNETAEDDTESKAKVLRDRSACLAAVGAYQASYDDAKAAVALKEKWGFAWASLGLAAYKLASAAAPAEGTDDSEEAKAAAAEAAKALTTEAAAAYFKAVQYEPTGPNVDSLFENTRTTTSRDVEAATAEKEKGNAALKVPDTGLAIAHYTCAIAQAPQDLKDDEPSAALKAALFCNRSLAFQKLRSWDAAVADGRQAVKSCGLCAKAHLRLGTALLGVGRHEDAYTEFARGLVKAPADEQLRKARDEVLAILPLWRSVPAMARLRTRYTLDMKRPKGSSKVYAMSDLHYDHKNNSEWVASIDSFMFQQDVLIVAGNCGDSMKELHKCLAALRPKFRRVFFIPGNHEMWIHPSEAKLFPDSLSKFFAVLDLCDQLGVDVFPAPIAEDCFIVPLFSWYNAAYDEADPFADPKMTFDKYCTWPVDKDNHLWKYFLDLNKLHLQLPYTGTTITYSHMLPRQGLPYDHQVPKIAKAMGCEQLDEQVRAPGMKCKAHVYGHARKRQAKPEEGIMYICHHLGFENEHSDKEPIMCIYNGQSVCNRIIPIANEK